MSKQKETKMDFDKKSLHKPSKEVNINGEEKKQNANQVPIALLPKYGRKTRKRITK